jgi:hypothetical protein
MYYVLDLQKGDMVMQNEAEIRIKQELIAEILNLEKFYGSLKDYLLGAEYNAVEIRGNLQVFKDSLNKVSAYILALYNLKGQRIKIPWESLFTNVDLALATMEIAPAPKLRAAIQLAFEMSEPKIEQVMSYLANLKEFLK